MASLATEHIPIATFVSSRYSRDAHHLQVLLNNRERRPVVGVSKGKYARQPENFETIYDLLTANLGSVSPPSELLLDDESEFIVFLPNARGCDYPCEADKFRGAVVNKYTHSGWFILRGEVGVN